MKTIDNMPFLSIAGIIISILVGFVSTYAQLKDPETGMALFVALLAMIILFFVVSYVIEQIRKRIGQQNKNSEDIKTMRISPIY